MEIKERKAWNNSMLASLKRRELSTTARRWTEVMIQQNEARIAELQILWAMPQEW